MDTPSQDSFNRNNGRGPHQPHRPFHPYKNRRNNNFQQNNHYRNNRFNGPADGPNNFAPQGFSSPIVRNGGGGGEYFHNYRNNRNGGTANYRNDGFRNRKNFTPFKVRRLDWPWPFDTLLQLFTQIIYIHKNENRNNRQENTM